MCIQNWILFEKAEKTTKTMYTCGVEGSAETPLPQPTYNHVRVQVPSTTNSAM